MSNTRSVVVALALVAGCSKSGTPPVPPGSDQAAVPEEGGATAMDDMPAAAAPRKMQIRASLEGLDDIMTTVKEVTTRVTPDDVFDPLTQLQAALLSTGFGPGFLNNIDLDGLHAFALAIPEDGGNGVADLDLAGAVAVADPRRVLEGLPPNLRPQPLGEGLWNLRMEGDEPESTFELLFKEAGKELQFGLADRDLARAAGLRAQAGSGARVRAHAEEIPAVWLDAFVTGFERKGPALGRLGAVLKQLTSIDLAFDVGTDRDLHALASGKAPFHQLGLDPLGPPRAAATVIESRLPGEPAIAATLAFGNPSLLHTLIDRSIPVQQIPEPFAGIVKTTIAGAHGLLDGVANDVVFAAYLDAKGQATFVIAADLDDEVAAREGLRKVDEALVAALGAHALLQGKNENGKFVVDWKPASVKLTGVEADRLAVTVPLDYRERFEPAALFLDKKYTLEAISFVNRSTIVLAIGAGARGVAGEIVRAIAKPPKDALAQAPSLERARTVLGGCQLCITLDVVDALRARLLVLERKHTADKERQKEVREQLARVARVKKLGELDDLAGGVRVQADAAALGFVVPKSAVLASSESLIALKEINDFIQGTEPAPPPVAPSGTP